MSTQKKIRMGELLVRAGIIDEMQLQSALAQQKQWGGKLGRHVVQMGFTDSATIGKALAKQYGMPAVDLEREPVDLTLLKNFPEQFAVAHCALPFRKKDDRTVAVVIGDPGNLIACDEIEQRLGKRAEFYVSAEHLLSEVIDRAYRAVEYGQQILEPTPDSASVVKAQSQESDAGTRYAQPPGLQIEETPAVKPPAAAAEDEGMRELQSQLDAFTKSAPEPKAAVKPPAAAPVQAAPAPRAAPTVKGRLRQLILLESDERARRELRLALRREGFDVHETSDPGRVLDQIKEIVPDVLMLEVTTHDLAVVELAKKLKASSRFKHVPIVLTTEYFGGWRGQQDLKELSGVDAVLNKPISAREVLDRIEALLGETGRSVSEDAARDEARRLLTEGHQLFDQGDFDLAIDCFEQAVEFDETLAEGYLALAAAYERKQQIYPALMAYEKAAELEPNNFIVFKNLSLVYEKLGFKRKAYEAFERSARTCPNPQVKERIKAHMAKLL